jgi:signal transduction histidine kinase
MGWAQRLMPHSITAQITSLVAISVMLGIALVLAILWFVSDAFSRNDRATVAVARVSEITRLVRAAQTPAEIEVLTAMARRSGLEVRRVTLADLVPTTTSDNGSFASWLALRQLAAQPGIKLLKEVRDPTGPPSQIISGIDDDHALVFSLAIQKRLWPILVTPTALLVMIVLIFMLLLSVYAVRWVVAPLAEVANAAAAFGRSPQAHEALQQRGPREIIQVTAALNDMRTRIRALLDDRTRMLAAISHDLRTPLTRLRLRAERVSEESLRTAMLGDLTKVSRMLDETLDYLRDDARSETVSHVDLPSFLQTICSDFADMGHAVSYAGPARLSYACRPRALTRAVTNIVENAVKHGTMVTVALGAKATDSIRIEVADDGPGIPPPLRDRVFEPFFKLDQARRQDNSGFGLGLSIAQDIIKWHGGSIEMKARDPSGLRVLMLLPPKQLST